MKKRRFRLSKRLGLFAIGGGVAVLVIAFLVIYFVIFPTSSPKKFKIAAASSSSTASTPGSTTASGASGGGSAVTGEWKIASGSQAGYRVREKLAFLPAESDAVGRTSQITGRASLTKSGATVTISKASFDINVSSLKSDRSMRDERIHEIGLESSRYPTATFVLTKPLSVAFSAIDGKVATVPVTGAIEIHGTTKTRTLPVEMSLSGSSFQAVGSLTFPWSEFGMTAPSVGGFVNVTGKATMEFDLHMQRA